MKKISIPLVLLMFFCGCGSRDRHEAEISKVNCLPVVIHRYDLDLFTLDIHNLGEGLGKIQGRYRVFLGDSLNDPSKLRALTGYLENPRNRDFYLAVRNKYPELSGLETGLREAFRHFRYYFPEFRVPGVYAYISGGDYDFPVQYADSILLIGLDNYLGKDYAPYRADGVAKYRQDRMDGEHILPDCTRTLINANIQVMTGGSSLLDLMIEAGKRLYIQDLILPGIQDRLKIGYTRSQYEWIIRNEGHVWSAIIENRMLYSGDGKVARIFTTDGPFTAEFSKESPPLMGNWIGWQIVRRYMEKNPGVNPGRLIQEKDSQKILSLSGYKPEK